MDPVQISEEWETRIDQALRQLFPDLPGTASYYHLIGSNFSLLQSSDTPTGSRMFSMTGTISGINAYQVLDANGVEKDFIVEICIAFQGLPFFEKPPTKIILSETERDHSIWWDSLPEPAENIRYIFGTLHTQNIALKRKWR